MKKSKLLTIGIDATNIRRGGGVTHLLELLQAVEPATFGIESVVLWGSTSTLKAMVDRPWLTKRNPQAQNSGLINRTLWQRYRLSQAARDAGCDVLFVPGGSYAGNFHPVVTMSQNLLPFEMNELKRFGLTLVTLKLLLLRWTQSRSFRKTDGVIFLTEYARNVVLDVTGELSGQTCIVPHGLTPRFNMAPKLQRAITDYDEARPYRVLYVSIIDQYKHQWHVVEAVSFLRAEGYSVVLELLGPSNPSALVRLQTVLARLDQNGDWAHYRGAIPYDELHHIYSNADIGVFASSCENLPITLLETMAAGLPVVCSNRGPMPEVLGDAGLYFDPENPEDIAHAIRTFILDPELRAQKSQASFERCQQYSWERCAHHTFAFFATIAHDYPEEVRC